MTIRFEPQDIERLKGMLRYHPQGQETISAISGLMILQDLANELKYPINCFSELVKQVGEEKSITVEGRELKVAELKAAMPAYYFPITCEEDFFDKAAELMKVSPALLAEQMPYEEMPFEGEEVSSEMAPPVPPEIAMLKPPSEIPSSGFVGVTREEVEREKAKREVV